MAKNTDNQSSYNKQRITPIYYFIVLIMIAIAVALIYVFVHNKENDPPIVSHGEYNVHFIDVGQGDAILVDYGEYEILIDAGDNARANRTHLIDYLEKYVDGQLEIVVATHPHADHIGGMSDVFAIFEVGTFYHNGDPGTSATSVNLLSQINATSSEVRMAQVGDIIIHEILTLTVLSTSTPAYDTNNDSIVILMEGGGVSWLFTGDAERPSELNYIKRINNKVDILKLGHHGSRTSNSDELLATCKPDIAVYMCKTGNSYGHPHDEVIERLESLNITIYGTDTRGDIVISVAEGIYAVSCANSID